MKKFSGTIPQFENKIKLAPVTRFNNGHWKFEEPMGNGVGFIYVIRDLYLRRMYLGKKTYFGSGPVNAGKESNWKSYVSSSSILEALLRERPREEFEFICLEQYSTKGALAYAETWSLCAVQAPTKPEWYNTRIEAVSWKVREGITDRHKERLERIVNWGHFD